MIDYARIIERIDALLAEDTDASVTYAALEARMALEKVVYERLRQRHEYISHEQLKKWQPGAVINQIITDVDMHVTQTRTLRMAKQSAEGIPAAADDEWVELGTEVGFNAKNVAKMWQALAKLALHVRLPKHKDDHIPDYGDKNSIRRKVEEVRAELERLSKGTMSFSGLGETVSFDCGVCGEKNKRRAALLREDQRVFCFNPDCKASWKVHKQGDEFVFEGETCDFDCQGCGQTKQLPWRFFSEMKFDQRATFVCNNCDHRNYVEWRLTQVAPATDADESALQP
jgi:hypothetical protein